MLYEGWAAGKVVSDAGRFVVDSAEETVLHSQGCVRTDLEARAANARRLLTCGWTR